MKWALIFVWLTAKWILGDATPKKLIIETDLFGDVDDAGALLLAFTNDNVGLISVHLSYPSIYSVLAAFSLMGYYNHSHVLPVGIKVLITNDTFFDDYAYQHGEYASKVAWHWRQYAPTPWLDINSTAWLAGGRYRKILGDQSVTVVSLGFFDNLSAILSTRDDVYSPLAGKELVKAKVRELVIRGDHTLLAAHTISTATMRPRPHML
ncbi:hypothetical protein PT974_03396 [Cladobotryum mycophilum]|uniref:Inosine/uridine-preferring nucleoside hydrolase domain-containing protein n=1 Tax=Cladobotryum mycophilum TaxID=491253 RepID=A0ABR0SS68_9HYPO